METKGLESLIPKKNKSEGNFAPKDVFYLEISQIQSNPLQPRKTFSEQNLNSLAQSIKDYGILEPLVVAKVGNNYQLIAGQRRLLASKSIGLKKVPVIIKNADNKKKLELSLIENIQREDLNPIERAEAFKELKNKFNLSLSDIAKISGRSKSSISNDLRILDLSEDIKNTLKEGKITEGHAKAILGAGKNNQNLVFLRILRDGLNVRQAEKLVSRIKSNRVGKDKKEKTALDKKLNNSLEKIKELFKLDEIHLSSSNGKVKLTLISSSNKIKNIISKLSR